ncbi:MAG: hypothetical protein WDM88_01865 [Galbitalea sp.]
MAGAFWGLDVEGVRALATNLDTDGDQIDQILSKLTGILSSTQWSGPDADKFRNDWQGAHSTALRNVSQALHDTATLARSNAAAQEQVSQS